jgi:hypothetical protein
MSKLIDKVLENDYFPLIIFAFLIAIATIASVIYNCNKNYYDFELKKLAPKITISDQNNSDTIVIDGKTYVLKKQ